MSEVETGKVASRDGTTIVFNSDRDGGRLRGYLMDPDGSNVRLLDIDGWVSFAQHAFEVSIGALPVPIKYEVLRAVRDISTEAKRDGTSARPSLLKVQSVQFVFERLFIFGDTPSVRDVALFELWEHVVEAGEPVRVDVIE